VTPSYAFLAPALLLLGYAIGVRRARRAPKRAQEAPTPPVAIHVAQNPTSGAGGVLARIEDYGNGYAAGVNAEQLRQHAKRSEAMKAAWQKRKAYATPDIAAPGNAKDATPKDGVPETRS
jgi:hypothetical protein